MRTRKEIEVDIQKISEAKTRLQDEFNQLEHQEQATLDQLSEDYLAGNSNKSANSLVETRARKEATSEGLQLAAQRLARFQQELVDLDRVERIQKWGEYKQACETQLAKIRDMTGKAGLKGELDNLYQQVLVSRELIQAMGQDGQQQERQMNNVWVEGSRGLFVLWKMLDSVEYPNRFEAAREPSGEIVGFGKLP